MTSHELWKWHRKEMKKAMGGSIILTLIIVGMFIAIILLGLKGK